MANLRADLETAISVGESILSAVDQGHGPTIVPAEEYRGFVSTCLEKYRNFQRGKFEKFLVHWASMNAEQRQAGAEYIARKIAQEARLVGKIEVLSRLRKKGYFQHSPLRSLEKDCLDQMMMGQPRVPWDCIEAFLIYCPAMPLGYHYHPQYKMIVRCRCRDYYRKSKRPTRQK